MLAKRLTMLFVVFPLIAILTSCAHETPASPPSFSVTVRDVAAEQKLADCNQLTPKPIPSSAQFYVIDTLPQKMAGETDDGYRERLTPHERGVFDWFQVTIQSGKRWEVYCKV